MQFLMIPRGLGEEISLWSWRLSVYVACILVRIVSSWPGARHILVIRQCSIVLCRWHPRGLGDAKELRSALRAALVDHGLRTGEESAHTAAGKEECGRRTCGLCLCPRSVTRILVTTVSSAPSSRSMRGAGMWSVHNFPTRPRVPRMQSTRRRVL